MTVPAFPHRTGPGSSTGSYGSTRTGSRSAGGAGLGLAIVREIVAAHHGSVVITDRPGGGTRVTVQLPMEYAPDSSR